MITLKSGVPGSGKTLSMVAELLENSKLEDPRPVYTNITGLAIPHIFMTDCTAWRECPPGALIVIDEAFLFGYDGKSSQQAVPEYIRDLAVHRKDYSVDIVFIAQHPKLLHVALRRQVGKHQHYRRLFGWGRAVCYEWDQCQENLSATKTAVMTQFSYPKSVYSAYKSAEIHTKPRFKKPWMLYLPFLLLPLAVWAFPNAYDSLKGAMTGKGVPASSKVATAVPVSSVAVPPGNYPPGFIPLGYNPPAPVPLPAPVPSKPAVPLLPRVYEFASSVAGCISTDAACKCFDGVGALVKVERELCVEMSRSIGAVAFSDKASVFH